VRLGRDVLARDLYGSLGVEPGAAEQRIRSAYRRAIRQSHPDLHGHTPAWAAARTVELNLAAFVLLDPERRAAYDRARRGAAPARAASPYECVWKEAPAGPVAGASELRRDPDILRLLSLLRTPIGAALERVRVRTCSVDAQTALTFGVLCVAVFTSVVGAARPRSLVKLMADEPQRTALYMPARPR